MQRCQIDDVTAEQRKIGAPEHELVTGRQNIRQMAGQEMYSKMR